MNGLQGGRAARGDSTAGLYVHVPFCRRKCRYCDFYSRPPGAGEIGRFLAALETEAELRRPGWGVFGTVYIGGGTPSMVGAEGLARVLGGLRRRFALAPGAEVTVEANPLDVAPEWAEECLAAGFTRLSVGVQSTDEADLRFLGRLHHAADGPAAVRAARGAGFGNISIDLIYGLPGQTREGLRRRLAAAIEQCRPEHVSCYQLTYSDETPLGRDAAQGRVRRLAEEEERELFLFVHEFLGGLGYAGYEVSNFARDEAHRSRHNSGYWRHGEYLGLGPSAHSFRGRARSWNVRSVEEYLASVEGGRLPVAGREDLTDEQLAAETVMLALRTSDGLDLAEYRRRFGRDLATERGDVLRRWAGSGLAQVADGRVRPTLSGLAVADSLALELA